MLQKHPPEPFRRAARPATTSIVSSFPIKPTSLNKHNFCILGGDRTGSSPLFPPFFELSFDRAGSRRLKVRGYMHISGIIRNRIVAFRDVEMPRLATLYNFLKFFFKML